jgi:hypothetical protein
MQMKISFDLKLDGLASRLVENDEDQLFNQGIVYASWKAREEMEKNFLVGGRPSWPLTKDGRVPLLVTGALMRGSSFDAEVENIDDGFEMFVTNADRELVANVQDARYNFFSLPDEALENVANAFEEGALED